MNQAPRRPARGRLRLRRLRRGELRPLARKIAAGAGIVGFGLVCIYLLHLTAKSRKVLSELESLASNSYYHVFAEPLRVHRGMDSSAAGIPSRLARAGLRPVRAHPNPGEYRRTRETIEFRAPHAEHGVVLALAGPVVTSIEAQGRYVASVQLPPEHLTSFRSSLHERRLPLEYADFPPHLVAAVLAAEDRRFFAHPGLDWRGIGRAILRNLSHRKIVEGGSTITQQTVKLILNRTRRELPAKVDEGMLALLAERRFTKQEILQVYLNNVYLGQEGPFEVLGVAEGARYFFQKSLAELSEEQTIELAAAIRAPNSASPRKNRERLEDYTRAIARALPDVQLPSQAPSAVEDTTPEVPVLIPTHLATFQVNALTSGGFDFQESQLAYYFDLLEREWKMLRDRHRIQRPAILVAGVDPVLQRRAAIALGRGIAHARKLRGLEDSDNLQGAVASIDPRSGTLRAIVGGHDYSEAPFNRAVGIARQVGSTFKPLVFLAALGDPEKRPNITQSSWLPDEAREYQIGRQVWAPANFDGRFRGWVTARQALEKSINAATVALGMDVGVERVAHLAEQLGLQDKVPANPSVLLGAIESSPVRLAGAYSCLANGGLAVVPHTLVEVHVEENGEKRVLRPDRPEPRPVVTPQGAYIVTDMLVGALQSGTGASAAQWGYSHLGAGKTGTSDKGRDTWFVGYTPGLVTAVWVGHDDNAPTGLSGASAALPVWASTMRAWFGQAWDVQFDQPPGVTFRNIDPLTGDMAHEDCPTSEVAAYLQDSAPTYRCSLHEPSAGDRYDHLFGLDENETEASEEDRRKRGLWSRLRGALGG